GPRSDVPHRRAVSGRSCDRDPPAVQHLPGRDGQPQNTKPDGRVRRALDAHPRVHVPASLHPVVPRTAPPWRPRSKGPLMIRFEGVQRIYPGVTALAGLDLEIEDGELIALLGPSGCGKTTALRILGGFDRPDAGRVLVDDRDITNVPPNKRD